MKKRCLTVFLSLFSIFLHAGGVLTVPQSRQSITFDGEVKAEEYAGAVVLNNFFLSGTAHAPQERSVIYLLSDGQYLYAGAVMRAYALHPGSNMGKEFKAALQGENQPVWDDDSLELRAMNDRGEKFYFGFNANEATFIRVPARFARPEVRCTRGKGFFRAEMRLPLELLNGSWAVNFIRFEKRLKETSTLLPETSYNLWSHAGFFKLLKGDSDTSGFRIAPLSESNTGNFQLTFSRNISGKYTVAANGSSRAQNFSAVAGEAVTVTIPGVKKGDNRFTLSVETGNCRWNFPEYILPSPDSQFVIRWQNPEMQVTFNDAQVASGAVLAMVQKQNILEITSATPTVAFSLDCGTFTPFYGNFDGAESVKYENGQITLTAGKNCAAPYKFRKIFSVTPKVIQPYGVDNRRLLLSSGDAYDFEINPVEFGIFPLAGLRFDLLIPEEIEVVDVCSRVRYENGFAPFNWPPEHNMYELSSRREVTIGGKKYRHLTVRRNTELDRVPNMTRHYHSMRERCHIIFRSSHSGFKGEMQFLITAAAPALMEVPRTLPVEVGPPLTGIQPEKLCISLYAQMQGNLPHDTEAAIFDTWKRAGINELFLETTRKNDDFTMMFFLELENFGYYRSVPDFEPLMQKYPQLRAKTASGRHRGDISLTALADMEEEISGEIQAVFATLKNRYPGLKKLFWDFEHNPFNGLYADYSEISLAKFIRDYHIREENLTPALIREKYSSQWIDFRTRELGRAVRVISRAAAANGLELIMYSDYATAECPQIYGLDWQYINSAPAMVYCGYGRNPRIIARTRELVSPAPMVFGVLTNAGSSTYQRALLLRRILDSRGGILCWYERGTGGAELREIAAVTRVVSRCEDLIISGVDCTPQGLHTTAMADQIVNRQFKGQTATFILNEENVSSRVRITFPYPVQDLVSLKSYPAGKQLSLRIPAMQFAAFIQKEQHE